jgi:ubiquinone/menaquinone biosynthesis C-methylase UbiE
MTDRELERAKAVYRERVALGLTARYSLLDPGELFMAQERERRILGLMRRHGLVDPVPLRILEVGCGRGLPLVDWVRWGARPENLAGVDIMESFLREAAVIAPSAALAVASGGSLPFCDDAFDIVVQLTVFSSILDPAMRKAVAREMLRVARPGGALIWYDLRVPNPVNPNLRPIRRREIETLFPECSIDLRSSTLAPPLARSLARWSYLTCAVLSSFPLLRTHYAALIRKPSI